MPMPTGNRENHNVYWQWTIENFQNWLYLLAKRLRRRRVYQHGFQVCHLKNTGLSTTLNAAAGYRAPARTFRSRQSPHTPGKMGTRVPIFPGVWWPGIPILGGLHFHPTPVYRWLVSWPVRARLPARNGLVNEVEFLGLIPQNGGRPMRLRDR